jgi:hypothetical protein
VIEATGKKYPPAPEGMKAGINTAAIKKRDDNILQSHALLFFGLINGERCSSSILACTAK